MDTFYVCRHDFESKLVFLKKNPNQTKNQPINQNQKNPTVSSRGQKCKQCLKNLKNLIENKRANIIVLLHKPVVHPNLEFCLHFCPLLEKQTSCRTTRNVEELVWNSFHKGHNYISLGSPAWK